VKLFLTFGIFFTLVFYDAHMLSNRGKWLMLDPVARLLHGLSASVVRRNFPALHWYLYVLTVSLFGFLSGFAMFKQFEPAFAESV